MHLTQKDSPLTTWVKTVRHLLTFSNNQRWIFCSPHELLQCRL